jgi:predicted O-linked N-acetylglucosamine transferase (SPINDLY family)
MKSGKPFDEALALHQTGRLDEAEQIYRCVLKHSPGHAGALHLLGVIHQQREDHEAAAELIGRAVSINPNKAVYRNNYGASLLSLGRYDEAIESFLTALTLSPNYADALANLALAQAALGQESEAIASCRKALAVDPRHRDARRRLAVLLQGSGRLQDALTLFGPESVDQRSPEDLLELGNLLENAGCSEAASEHFRQLTARQPDNAKAHFLLATAYESLYRCDQARESFRRAAELCPDNPFWQLRPVVCCPPVWESEDEITGHCEKVDQVLKAWRIEMHAAERKPPSPPAPLPSTGEGRKTPSLRPWVHGARALPCMGEGRSTLSADEIVGAGVFPSILYSYQGRDQRELKERIAAIYRDLLREGVPVAGSGLRDRKRIGMLVTRRHEGMFLQSMQGILRRLDFERFDIVILCPCTLLQTLRAKIACDAICFVPLSDSVSNTIRAVRKAACDLIYYWEVGTDALNYFLPFARLAPVQCTGWGSTITSGVPAVDYFMSSELVEKPGSQAQYTERLWKSRTLFRYQDRLPAIPPGSRSEFGLPDDRNLYVCFQNPLKLHPDFDPLLAGVLAADPKALIVLLADKGGQIASLLKSRFERQVPASERIVFLPMQKFPDYCRLLQMADVVLDPLHYGAGSTCYDLFSFNLPVVTLPGELIVGRVTQGCYRKMGVADLIVESPQEYIDKAVQVATDRDYRRYVVDRIGQRSDVLFNDLEVVREHERFFEGAMAQAR